VFFKHSKFSSFAKKLFQETDEGKKILKGVPS